MNKEQKTFIGGLVIGFVFGALSAVAVGGTIILKLIG